MSTKFENVMSALGVTPLSDKQTKVQPNKPKLKPEVQNVEFPHKEMMTDAMRDEASFMKFAVEANEELHKPGGISRLEFTRLRRGRIDREAEVYLRGLKFTEASEKLKKFIQQSVRNDNRCVKIIHGKGLHSPDGISQIKLHCEKYLAWSADVLAYTRALPSDGESGAKYVLLRRRKN